MEENQFQEIPQTLAPGRSKKPLPKKTVVLVAIIVLITLAVLFVKLTAKSEQRSTSTASATPFATETPASNAASATPTPTLISTPTSTPTPTASPTPKPSVNPVDKATGLDRSTLNVVVQNGSGEAGVASKASDYLTGLGYNVTSTGNADNYDYTNVTVQVKADKSDFLALLKKDLGFNYTVGNTSSDLPDSSTEDALVIIGK